MTNYPTTRKSSPITQSGEQLSPRDSVQEKREARKKVLEQVRKRRAEAFKRLAQLPPTFFDIEDSSVYVSTTRKREDQR